MRKFIILLLCLVPFACSPEKGWTDPEPIHPDNPQTQNEYPLDGCKYSAECQYSIRYNSINTKEYPIKLDIVFGKKEADVTLEFLSQYGQSISCRSSYSVSSEVVRFTMVSLPNYIFLTPKDVSQFFSFKIRVGYLIAKGNALDVDLIRENQTLGTNTQTIRLSKK